MVVDCILRGARLLDGELTSIAVDAGRIVAIGPLPEFVGGQEIELGGAVVLPGFVDVHHHLDKAYVVEELGPGKDLLDARDRYRAYKARLTADHVYGRGKAVLERLVRHGTCALRTHVDIDDAVELRGVEGVLALRRGYADRLRLQVVAFPRGEADPWAPEMQRLLRGAIELGCDCLGGTPNLNAQPQRYVDAILALARETGCRVDLHVEENTEPDASVLEYIAEATIREGLQGRVTCSHCCSLGLIPDDHADRIIAKVKEAGLFIATQPLTNLFLQGGGRRVPGARGLTRVRDLWNAGVTVCCGADNIQDPFNPYGNGDPLLTALIAGLALRLGAPADQRALLDSVTTAGAAALGLTDYGLRPGARADLVALDCTNPAAIIAEQPARKLVLLAGQNVAERAVGSAAGEPGAAR